MDAEDTAPDFYLRSIPNVQISKVPPSGSPKLPVREQMQALHLSEASQRIVMEALNYIHGPDFILNDVSAYKDRSSNISKKYWTERGNLVIRGGFDYSSIKPESELEEDRLRTFALLRLESYGFHKTHCLEAFDYVSGQVEEALQILYWKYFKIHENPIAVDFSDEELLEQRRDEKSVLESIYEKAFSEKIKDCVWVFNLKLNYLVDYFIPSKKVALKPKVIKKEKPKCKGFLKGHCKFGSKCRFAHELEVKEPFGGVNNSHLFDYNFELEIRFPRESKYPFEPPLLFFKTNIGLPELMNLHIAKYLLNEAKTLANDGMPSIYSVVQLLENEEEIITYIKTTKINFIRSEQLLFPPDIVDNKLLCRPTHYQKGTTNRDTKKQQSVEQILAEDRRIANNFLPKCSDPKYLKLLAVRKALPAWGLMTNILNTIASSQVTVISGETGCGKTTQVPQFILDDWLLNFKNLPNKHTEIVCTQPRRISAIGVAERVAEERIEKVGHTVGYQIRLESKVSASTRLTFCTTGILLRRLESDPNLTNVSHVIVDEVHERSEESDFLLLILRDLLPVRPELRVILMSATMNAQLFSDYFGDIPILEIPGRTFPVDQYFLEDILDMCDFVLEENTQYTRRLKQSGDDLNTEFSTCDMAGGNALAKDNVRDENLTISQILTRFKGYSMQTCKSLYLMNPDKINLDLIESILSWIVSGDHDYPRKGSILIFLPGIAEITALYDQLNDHPDFCTRNGKYLLIPLHSSLTGDEQAAVFKHPKHGVRKIVLSTNIAETSVTIDDCVFVIDAGKMKEKHFDSNRNMESLELVWVTRANALQRKGRAGRVMAGVCIHLFTNHRFKHHMMPQPIPEIHRVPLEQLLLHIKVLPNFDGKTVFEVLDKLLEPPVRDNIESAVIRLQDVGAFDKENNLTPLGHHLAALPVDVRIGKLMLYGAIFSCVDSALTVAACLNYKSPFVSPFNKREQADKKKREFSVGYSDQITVLMAYKKWQEMNSKSRIAGNNFANENYLSVKTLETLVEIKYQFLELLVSIGFVPVDLVSKNRAYKDNILQVTGPEFNVNSDNIRLLSSILCAALYPNVVKVLIPEKSYIASAAGAVPKEHEAKDFKFKTKKEQVFLHPTSVNYVVKNYPSPYLVYQEKLKTSKIYIKDCSMVPIVPLVLFSGCDVEIHVHNGDTFLVLEDSWILFRVNDHRIAEMIKMIRLELLDLLEEKIKDPLLNLAHHDKGEKVIAAILHMVTND